MPVLKNGDVSLSFWKGMLCWLCVALWWCGWYFLYEYFSLSPWVYIIGASCFGVVPIMFFSHEERKCKKRGRRCLVPMTNAFTVN